MGHRLSEEQWKAAFDLAHVAAELPPAERRRFLESSGHAPEVVRQVFTLIEAFGDPTWTGVQVGDAISHFLVTGRLGSGGMGEVFSATDTELQRPVALKFLKPAANMMAGAMERFIREGRTASSLNHPNIVTIYEVVRTEAGVAIAMELVEGKTLRELDRERLPLIRLLPIGEQTAQALAAAHATGIIHRDIKPENIILRPDGRVKVMDFGLARWVDRKQDSGVWMSAPGLPAGTWRYMSPEQCRGETLTPATDIFSMGLVFYELCAGRQLENLQAPESGDPPPPSEHNGEIPKELDSLILQMLAKDPGARPTAERVAEELGRMRGAGPITWTPPHFLMRRQRRATPWAALAAVGIVAVGLTGYVLQRSTRAHRTTLTQVTTLVAENHATAAAISPDGRFTAYANVDGVFLRTSQDGDTAELKRPENFVADRLAWFPDGTKLVVSGFSTVGGSPSVWMISITGKAPQLLREDARVGMPSFDGLRIASLSGDWSQVWVTNIGGESPRKVLEGPAGDTFSFVTWAADGRHLILQRRHYATDQDLGRVVMDRYFKHSLEVLDLETSQVVSSIPNLWVESAAALQDGTVLLLRMARGGSAEGNAIWQVHANPRSGVFEDEAHTIGSPLDGERGLLSGLSCTADGKQILFVRRSDATAVFVADYSSAPPTLSNPRRLTLDERWNYPHAWTPDSKAVIFESDRNGSWDLYKQRVDQRMPDVIVNHPARAEVLPQVAGGGKWVLYAAGEQSPEPRPLNALMRVALDGGTAEPVPVSPPVDNFHCGIGPRQPCVIRTSLGRQYYAFHELDPIRGMGAELARTSWTVPLLGDWDVSPNGKMVAAPNHDSQSAKIRMLQLSAEPSGRKEWEVELKGLSNLSSVIWAPSGDGWFVSMTTTVGGRLYYAYLDGRTHLIGDIQGWAVPSPDGRRVAYLDRIVAANAWLLSRM